MGLHTKSMSELAAGFEAGDFTSVDVTQALLDRIGAHDASAVSECIDAYGGLVWSLARRFTRTREDAEDAVREIFLALWRGAKRFDPASGSEQTFIATIARRRLIDRSRARAGPGRHVALHSRLAQGAEASR